MEICHAHNLSDPADEKRLFGVRVRLLRSDPINRLLGDDFERTHWFRSAIERDRALADMAAEHLYSRRGDRPTLHFDAIDRS